MDTIRWFEISKEALSLAETELDTSQIDLMVLIQLDTKTQTYSTSSSELDVEYSALLGQAWNFLLGILTNELQLESWNSITIKSRNKAITLYHLGNDLILMIVADAAVDSLDVIKIILKFVFQIGYKEKYETVGLVSAEGYPIWVSSIEEMDEFLFAISITSLLSLVERIDMEVSAGGVENCILQGTENLLLNVAFNPSQDLALAVTQQGQNVEDITLDSELNSLYQKIVDPIIYNAIVPEVTDEDRERMLEEIRQAFEGETTEEEIQMLTAFDTEMLKSLENEITTVAKKYGANEISIGYLRRRMRLPSEVLSMALEYLIGEGSIKGKVGEARESKRKILVLDPIADISNEEKNQIACVQSQINDLFIPLKPYTDQLPKILPPREAAQEVISEALGEFQIMLTLADTDPLYLLVNDIRFMGTQMESSTKTLVLVETQLSETSQDDVLQDELRKRIANLEGKISEQQSTSIGKVKKFYEDLLNFYRLLSRLLPPPDEFKGCRSKEKATVFFRCAAHGCSSTFEIKDYPSNWVKISIFAIRLGIKEEFPEKSPQIVIDLKNSIETYLKKLISSTEETAIKTSYNLDEYIFLETLDELLITNAQRDEAINLLKQSSEEGIDKNDFYSLFSQCGSCNKWYCKNHMYKASKCKYCG